MILEPLAWTITGYPEISKQSLTFPASTSYNRMLRWHFFYFLFSPGKQLCTAQMYNSIVQCTLSISSPINYSHIHFHMSCIVGHHQYKLELSSVAAHVIHFSRVSEFSSFLHFTFSDSTNARNSCFHPAGEDEPSNPQASPQLLCCDPTKPAKCSSFYQQLSPSTYPKRN